MIGAVALGALFTVAACQWHYGRISEEQHHERLALNAERRRLEQWAATLVTTELDLILYDQDGDGAA